VHEISVWHDHFCTGDLFFLFINFGKNHFHEPTVQKSFDQFRCKFNFVQLWRVFSTRFKFKRSNLEHVQEISAWYFAAEIFLIYLNCGKNIIFTSLPFKNHLTNSVANLILYTFGGSSVHVISFKALTQGT
jgi:hypothetical protein